MIYSQEERKKPLIHYVNGMTFKPKRKDSNMRLVDSISVAPYKFSIGDRIRLKGNTLDDVGHYIVDIREDYYWCDADITIPRSYQDRYETFQK